MSYHDEVILVERNIVDRKMITGDHTPEARLVEAYERAYKMLSNLIMQRYYDEITRDEMYKLYLGIMSDVSFYEGYCQETLRIKGKEYRKTSACKEWYIRRTG